MNHQPKYNNKDQINNYLKDLAGLNKLSSDRHDAGYTRNERLEEFIILGRWVTDRCGDFGKIISDYSSFVPAECMKKCPPVMTFDEYRTLKGRDSSISWNGESELPPDYVKCIYCEQGWTINDCHDCHVQNITEVIDATPFTNAKLSNIKKLPQFDLNPHYVNTDHVRHEEQTEGSSDVDKNYLLKAGDKIFARVWYYSHNECHKLNIINSSIKEMNELFNKIEAVSEFKLTLLKNQYHSDYGNPWFRVMFKTATGDREILIGWRKRVINIDWSKSGKDLLYLFDNEKVTKGSNLIHAYGYEKALEYLTKIIAAL